MQSNSRQREYMSWHSNENVWECITHQVCAHDAASALVMRRVDKLSRCVADRLIWKWETEERQLSRMLDACFIRCKQTPWRWVLQTWVIEHNNPVSDYYGWDGLYKCSVCGDATKTVGGCLLCARKVRLRNARAVHRPQYLNLLIGAMLHTIFFTCLALS